jgi:hypothetical protein
VTDDATGRLLAATDLDELAEAYADLAITDHDARVRAVVEDWTDVQAVANAVMCPLVIAPDLRLPAVLRALRDEQHPYLRLAGAVGAGHLPVDDLDEQGRRALLDALLDLVAGDAGPAGVRASAEVGPLLRPGELDLLDDLAAHPVEAVRHNLAQAALGITDPDARQPVLLPYLPALGDYPDQSAGLRATT